MLINMLTTVSLLVLAAMAVAGVNTIVEDVRRGR